MNTRMIKLKIVCKIIIVTFDFILSYVIKINLKIIRGRFTIDVKHSLI